jgi:hypothetical protein
MKQSKIQKPESPHEFLWRIGGIATLLNLIVMLFSVAGYIKWPFAAGTTPTETIYGLIQNNLWAAFIALDLGVSITNLVSILVYVALYFALRKEKEISAVIAMILGLVAVVAMIVARPIFEIFSLSNLYFSAISISDKTLYLISGETLLAQFHGTAWHISMFLSSISSLIFANLMLHSPYFSRTLAYIGIVTFGLGTLFWLPGVGIMILFISMLGSVPWAILLARSFFHLVKVGSKP